MVIAKSKKLLDLEFGELGEKMAIPVLDKFFGCKHVKSSFSHDRWDYLVEGDPNVRRELKSRRINHDDYPTAVLNHSKITNQLPNIKYCYIWHYVDGWYYLEYDPNVWTVENGFIITQMDCWRDGRCERQPVINIPHERLIRMD